MGGGKTYYSLAHVICQAAVTGIERLLDLSICMPVVRHQSRGKVNLNSKGEDDNAGDGDGEGQ
jgi:hypothetical protein